MKEIEEIKDIVNQHRQELEERFKAKSIAIFGFYARGDQTSESNIDIMVEFREPVGFLFIHLADYLEQILEIKVDLLTREAIKPNRRRYIMEELVYV